MTVTALSTATDPTRNKARSLWVACGAHALHDGFTDTLYVLLPIWQAQFVLSYAAIGILRALYTGVMAGFQVPVATAARRIAGARILAAGTAAAAVAYLFLGTSYSVAALAIALVLGGLGSSTQHPIASSLVAAAYAGPRSRGALGTYNFAGDLGKMALPSITAGLIAVTSWRSAASVIGVIGLLGRASSCSCCNPDQRERRVQSRPEADKVRDSTGLLSNGFLLLLAIGVIDSATRMGFLTFLPFLLRAKGAEVPEIGLALTLVFAGGAAGKLVCGYLGARLGVLATVLLTEGATAAGILALLPLPVGATLVILPIIGVALNGTSSVLYGTVPELVTVQQRETAFGMFYTGTIGAGALSPALYGLFGDAFGLTPAMLLVAVVVLLTLPLAWQLTRVFDATDLLQAATSETSSVQQPGSDRHRQCR
jgi:MFS transporter, FSR family, fosmidomycin resistance protein